VLHLTRLIIRSTLLYLLQSRFSISGQCLAWFQSYLSGQTQVFTTSTSQSAPIPLATGVPQGSVLSPIQFIAYTLHITQQTFQIPFLLITFCITCLQSTRTSISYENIVRFSQDCLRSILVGHFQSRENEKIRNSPLVTHYIQVNQFARQYNRAPKPPICE